MLRAEEQQQEVITRLDSAGPRRPNEGHHSA
jgi:hypothetical protein